MSKTMSAVILLAAFCSTFFTLSYSANTLVESTCQKTPFPSLCISTLNSDPRSASEDESGLARIMADSVGAKAVDTKNQIEELLKTAQDPSTKAALNVCLDAYNAIVHADIPVAIDAILKNNPKFAVDSATDAANEAQICADGFLGKSPNSHVPGSNMLVHELSLILESIAGLLL